MNASDILSILLPYLESAPMTVLIVWVGYLAVSRKYLREMDKMKSEIEKIKIENQKLLSEIQQINFNIAKDKMEKAILFSKMKKDFFVSIGLINEKLTLLNKGISKSNKTQLQTLRDEIDLMVFRNIILTINEICMSMDYFLEKDFERRNDFILDTILPTLEVLQTYFAIINDDWVLQKTNSEKSIIHSHEFQSVKRFLLNSEDNANKAKGLEIILNITT